MCQTNTNFMPCVVCAASTHGLCVVYRADVSIVFECGTYGISVSECVWYERGCTCECRSRVCLWVCIWLCVVYPWVCLHECSMSVDERGVYSENMVAFGRAWPVVYLQVWVWQSACVCDVSG